MRISLLQKLIFNHLHLSLLWNTKTFLYQQLLLEYERALLNQCPHKSNQILLLHLQGPLNKLNIDERRANQNRLLLEVQVPILPRKHHKLLLCLTVWSQANSQRNWDRTNLAISLTNQKRRKSKVWIQRRKKMIRNKFGETFSKWCSIQIQN